MNRKKTTSRDRKSQEQLESRCAHTKWNIDSQNVGTCANPDCEEVRQFPFEKDGEIRVLRPSKLLQSEGRAKGLIWEQNARFEANKTQIIDDLLTTGRRKTREKWNIHPSTLVGLEERWLTAEQRKSLNDSRRCGRPKGSHKADDNSRVPALPDFSNEWDASVQLKWLQIYEKLVDRENNAKNTEGYGAIRESDETAI